MATSDPIGTIDKGGKPGRPATVKRTAERAMAKSLYSELNQAPMIAAGIPRKELTRFSNAMATVLLEDLREIDLHVIPGRIVTDLSLLVGRGAVNDDELSTKILGSGDGGSPTGNPGTEDAGIPSTEGLDESSEDPGGCGKEADEVA